MIDLRLIEPNKIYRNKTMYRFPLNTEKPTHGSVYLSASKSSADTVKFFSRPHFMVRHLLNYYTEKLYNYRIYNSIVKYRITDSELKENFDKNIAGHFPKEFKLRLTKDSLNQRNFIFDALGILNEKFFGLKDSRVGKARIDEYFRLFKEFTVDKIDNNDYSNRVLFIPIDEWVLNTRDAKLFAPTNTTNLISMLYHKFQNDPEYFSSNFAGWKFYFIYDTQLFYMIPDEISKDTAKEFRNLLTKIVPMNQKTMTFKNDDEEDNSTVEAINKTSFLDKIEDSLIDKGMTPTDDMLNSLIDKSIEKSGLDISTKRHDITYSDIVSEKEIELEKIQAELSSIDANPRSKTRLAREAKLMQDIKNIKVNDMTIDEIQTMQKRYAIDEVELPINTVNSKLKKMKFPNFDKAYLDNLFTADVVNMMAGLQYKDRPLYLLDTTVKDVSTELDSVLEYSFKFEDEAGRRHNFTVLLPKVIDGRFMKIAGNKKVMSNQIIPIPIMKTAPDTVQIATDYNKVFIKRFGQTVSPKISVMIKTLASLNNRSISVITGVATKGNQHVLSIIEYDEMAKKYRNIKTPKIEFIFNQLEIRDKMRDLGIKIPSPTSNILPIAIKGKEVIFLDVETGLVQNTNSDLLDYIARSLSEYEPSIDNAFKSIKAGKKLMYSRAKIMAKNVPVIILLSYLVGLLNVLKRADIKYRIVSKSEQRTLDINKGREDAIEFADCWLVYNIYPLRNSLLLNGFYEIPTKAYELSQFLSKDVYYDLFETLYGRKNIGFAFENYQQLLIDPVAEEILRSLNLPTDFIDVFIYANSLLEDNAYNDDGDMSVHRVRSNEMIYAFLYKTFATAYEKYRLSADSNTPQKLSVRKEAVIISMLQSQVTKDYSDLNPVYTLDLMRSTTFKGPSGMNEDRAFKLSKRAFDKSMVGVLTQASPISGAIGIARTLSVDSNITNARGFIKVSETKDDVNNLTTSNLLSGGESLALYSPTSDEPERVAMLSAQSKHTLACVGSSASPVTSGFDRALPHLIGDTFVFKAKKDGQVIKIDPKSNTMIVRYSDNTTDLVNMNPDMGKNAGSGFYLSNTLVPVVKVGDTFKANKILAHHDEFFTVDKRTGDSVFMTGPLARTALRISSKVFEDSKIISKRLSEKLSSYIVIKKPIILGSNSNIDFMVKKGQEIKVNDPLVVYDTSYDDDMINKSLAKMVDQSTKDILEASKTPIVSKHNGVIEDLKIYYTVPKEELSKTAREIIEFYENDNKTKLSDLAKITKKDVKDIDMNITEVIQVKPDNRGKVKGEKVGDGLLIEIYIKYLDQFSVGDKSVSASSALKSIACDIFEEGKEPYLLSDPEDKIDAYYGVIGVSARITESFIKVSQLNAVIVGMKKNIKKLYEEMYKEKL